ncbi:hypothetical protein REPUB_Repub13aG0190800 [Reevesia pubescens]
MRRLRQELKKSMEMFNSVNKEAVVAKEKARMLQEWKAAEERKLEEARLAEEAATALAEAERQKTSTYGSTFSRYGVYRQYTIDEIEAATNYFANSNQIGEGGYGPVFKANLNHTTVAVKVLRPDISQRTHAIQPRGACSEYGCLVYEYMENGSLEDRHFRKDNTLSIPCKTRFIIAAEIATGLLFLHQTKPEPLVDRDLKACKYSLRPELCKINDVGLSRLVPASFSDSVTEYRLTAAQGTFCYIDPEYRQSGTLAKLALQCCELRKRDSPDLDSVVLPELNRLRDLALEHEANHYEKVSFEPRLYNSVPQIGSQENQLLFIILVFQYGKSTSEA